jgi:hypothetical protein
MTSGTPMTFGTLTLEVFDEPSQEWRVKRTVTHNGEADYLRELKYMKSQMLGWIYSYHACFNSRLRIMNEIRGRSEVVD